MNVDNSHYDNSKGSLYQFAEDHKLNSYEFDLIKRIVRCRKKGQFREDLLKSKILIDLYLEEYEDEEGGHEEFLKSAYVGQHRSWTVSSCNKIIK